LKVIQNILLLKTSHIHGLIAKRRICKEPTSSFSNNRKMRNTEEGYTVSTSKEIQIKGDTNPGHASG